MTTTKRCPRCGRPLKEEENKCPNCGSEYFAAAPSSVDNCVPSSTDARVSQNRMTPPPAGPEVPSFDTGNENKHLALWIGIATAVVVIVVGALLFFNSGGSLKSENSKPAVEKKVVVVDAYSIMSTRRLTEKDIKGRSSKELKLMRNEIYARHGLIFKNKEMRNYFSKKSWYHGTTTKWENIKLNEYERYNVDFLKKHE